MEPVTVTVEVFDTIQPGAVTGIEDSQAAVAPDDDAVLIQEGTAAARPPIGIGRIDRHCAMAGL